MSIGFGETLIAIQNFDELLDIVIRAQVTVAIFFFLSSLQILNGIRFFFVVEPCINAAEIGFIVDSSGSLRRDYNKEKEFVKILADSIGIEEGGSRAGIVTFSYDAELSVKLSDFRTTAQFKEIVDKLPFMGYTTRIDKALTLAKDQLFQQSTSAGRVLPKIIFLLTDGRQTRDQDAVDPATIASEIREEQDVKIIVIGIGAKINKEELIEIAGNSSLFFHAKNLKHLKSVPFVRNVAGHYCEIGLSMDPSPNQFILASIFL